MQLSPCEPVVTMHDMVFVNFVNLTILQKRIIKKEISQQRWKFTKETKNEDTESAIGTERKWGTAQLAMEGEGHRPLQRLQVHS